MIGEDIEITVVAVEGDKVRLEIKAPKDIQVHRKEVYQPTNSPGKHPGYQGIQRTSK